jgi:phospholipid/cholesterol/gamma-HCH transport system substrate-binding protein
MILTRTVKTQLVALAAASLVGTTVLGLVYLRVPEAVGLGRYSVTASFTHGAQLYDGAEVTYEGHPVGKVTDMAIADKGIDVTMSLRNDVSVPGNVLAEIHSRSAVGEQYVDLVPAGDASSSLGDGDVIPVDRTSTPVEIGPLLDDVGAFADSLPARDLNRLLREAGAAFHDRREDLASLVDNSAGLIATADEHLGQTRRLIDDFDPFAAAVNDTGPEFDQATRDLAGVTAALRRSDRSIRALLDQGPGLATETTKLLDGLGETMPQLLQDLGIVSEQLAVYHDPFESILSTYPLVTAMIQSITLPFAGSHQIALDLANFNDPPACIDGFIPPDRWRDPADQSPMATPRVYCDIAASDPRVVKGARNLPCLRYPGLTGATAEICRRRAGER